MVAKSQTLADLRWDDLRVLLALHRRGSLKRAATELGVNISTVSRRLDALEAATGLHLFDRTPDGTRPTAAADQIFPFAERMEDAAAGLSRGLDSLEAEPEGEVRLTAPPGVVDHFVAPAIPELVERYPRLSLQLIATIGYADMTRREADVALRMIRPAAGDFTAKRLASVGWCVLAAPDLAERLGSLRDPNAARWVTWGPELAHLPDRGWIEGQVDAARRAFVTSSMTAQIEAVRAGYGLMIAPQPYGHLPGLAVVRLSRALRRSLDDLPTGALWLVTHRALRDVPRIAAVWSWLETLFARPAR